MGWSWLRRRLRGEGMDIGVGYVATLYILHDMKI